MCAHPDHEVTRDADGFIVAETHVLTDEDMAEILAVALRREPRAFVYEGEHGPELIQFEEAT